MELDFSSILRGDPDCHECVCSGMGKEGDVGMLPRRKCVHHGVPAPIASWSSSVPWDWAGAGGLEPN